MTSRFSLWHGSSVVQDVSPEVHILWISSSRRAYDVSKGLLHDLFPANPHAVFPTSWTLGTEQIANLWRNYPNDILCVSSDVPADQLAWAQCCATQSGKEFLLFLNDATNSGRNVSPRKVLVLPSCGVLWPTR